MSGNEQNSTPIKNRNDNRRDRASTEPPISMSSGGDPKGVGTPCMIIMAYRTPGVLRRSILCRVGSHVDLAKFSNFFHLKSPFVRFKQFSGLKRFRSRERLFFQ